MNQDQVKSQLLAIAEPPMEFEVIFSGKKSRKVNGLYKPDTREIIIHNRNFQDGAGNDDNLLLYTAIHEYAHHLHACSRGGKLSPRAHTAEFRAILHELLEKAEAQGVYRNVFEDSPELAELTELIRKKYLAENGALVKELGDRLLKAHELIAALGGRFEDYLDRALRIPRTAAYMAIRMFQYDLDSQLGADNMRILAGIPNRENRIKAEEAMVQGKSPDRAKLSIRPSQEEEDPRERLEKEKSRLEKTIESLSRRLAQVEEDLEAL